ncbi:MAG TPA: ROK family protein, partial [Acidimicrobiia bacterium]|nr:ROK family protein [Acidimicrobiia bacterium]
MSRYGTVELGGTWTSCAVGSSPDHLSRSVKFSTSDPTETLRMVAEFMGSETVDAVGVAAFGPLDLERGRVGVTPKEGWSGIDLLGPLREALDAPIGLDTDVIGAALGEGRWGAGRGFGTFVYVTVGTGIGGGALVDGQPLHGLGHPEMGHISVRRHPDDDYRGVCMLHVDCLEGLASGPAIEQRLGRRGQDLMGTDLATAVELESFYLSQMMRDLV